MQSWNANYRRFLAPERDFETEATPKVIRAATEVPRASNEKIIANR